MESEELKMFFSKLADKFRKENDLSDITWALCETNLEFKKLFLSFFFSEIKDVSGIFLTREYSKDSSRVDFFFEKDNKDYIIEVKKGDQDDHFEDYKRVFEGARFGWIANYEVAKNREDGIEIRTWNEFKEFLENSSNVSNFNSKTILTTKAYCEYLRKVCSIIKINKMKFENLSSLHSFYRLIEKIINNRIKSDIICSPSSKGIREYQTGMYFKLSKSEHPENAIYPWFGIFYYDEKSTCVCIYFGWQDCNSVYDNVKRHFKKGKYYEKWTEDDWNGLRVNLQQEHFDKFNSKESSVEIQEQILKEFLNEVVENIKQYL